MQKAKKKKPDQVTVLLSQYDAVESTGSLRPRLFSFLQPLREDLILKPLAQAIARKSK